MHRFLSRQRLAVLGASVGWGFMGGVGLLAWTPAFYLSAMGYAVTWYLIRAKRPKQD